MKALEVLINSINAQIEELNKSDFKIYDGENVDYYVTGIMYCKEDNRIYFEAREDKNNE